jgi:nucleotide-binding universal stress UspA family protein
MTRQLTIGAVLVPLDGSELAEQALVYGQAFAERFAAPLHLVSVIPPGEGAELVVSTRDYLRATAERLPATTKVHVRRGNPVDEILLEAGELRHPLIVMSTHGRSGVRRWITGSVANQVVRLSRDPVLLTRSGQEMPRVAKLAAIMAPVDGSESSEQAAFVAADIARAFESRIHLVRVVDTPTVYGMMGRHPDVATSGEIFQDVIESLKREALTYVDDLATRLAVDGISVKPVVIEGFAGEQLLRYERTNYFNLVVMSTSGRTGVSRAVFGSVAERILKLGRSPVLMIGPAIASEEPATSDAEPISTAATS